MQAQPHLIQIQPLDEKHLSGILAVAEDLPEWFDETARTKSIPIDIRHQEGFVAVSGQRVVGFLTLFTAEGRLHIGWLAVARDFHRQGIGTRLLTAAEIRARELGIDEFATYTLGDSVDYEPYDLTRNFYRKHGFSVYKRSRTDNAGCPEEIRISKRVKEE
ncbi:MAG: GNAT family N-acetyltransferase [Candidatus Poribacteria bacterium]|nr:GNAT family N-acetyltransferase [Candidatus Poribacteria bacterium]